MFTDRRLNQAYRDAQVEDFEENSKYIIFSDTHRGDDSISDEFARNQVLMVAALEYYYQNGYIYIEAGDGDELWEHREFKHIRTAHSDVFTVIKKFYDEGRFTMLYGNHNIYLMHQEYTARNYYYFYNDYTEKMEKLFYGLTPIESVVLKYKKTGQEILVVHGHQGDLFNDQLWFIAMFSLRYFWRFAHLVGFKNPASPSKNQSMRHKIEKQFNKWIAKNRKMLICGHTHRMKFPKKGQLPYFNSGCCIHTKGIMGIEILEGKIMIVQWRIEANKEGILSVVRSVIRGPKPIDEFDIRKKKYVYHKKGR